MKKFNLKKAKEGAEVVTAEGKEAKILYTERSSQFSVVAIINNVKIQCYTSTGQYYADKKSDQDLKLK